MSHDLSSRTPLREQLAAVASWIRERHERKPAIGIILGSGLGAFADGLKDARSIPYAEIPGFPTSNVAGHAGRLVLGRLGETEIVAMQGRVHAYEGYAPWQVAFPARVLCTLGIRGLVVTNAAGGIRADLAPGDLMMITDHLNLSGMNPLVGPNDDELGPRFPDMSRAYDPALGELLERVAESQEIALRAGVYASLSGPTYETPAEIRMLRILGADAVGMSTVPEVIAAAHMGVPTVGISCITNFAAGIGDKPLSHEDVAHVAEQAKDRFSRLLREFLPRAASVLEVSRPK